eukprot:CAMPEP_0204271680 /NCGR_PEP_ID=MMETSP0468-20130131/20714_1 /ASSEMBLY_ACC=CAM_ASM_000383 /TAXON_ID=2969 /ORGANISM="Oxyrrhis marina" /LENGTH=669 /DNA_ID=CAMNT_0051247415 /DNA_START=89 /DNA_END=2098 /DNA_ORIENTATION=-
MRVGVLLALGASSHEATPISKVLSMLDDLTTKITDEGRDEAKTYNTFSCFCSDKTTEKTEAVQEESGKIDTETANLETYNAEKDTVTEELGAAKKELNQKQTELDKEEKRWEEVLAEYTVEHTDMELAVNALVKAVTDVKAAKTTSEAGLAQIKAVIRRSLLVAESLGHSPPKHTKLVALLQGDGDDVPDSDYTSHSSDLIEILEKLETDFKGQKSDMEDDHAKKETAHDTKVDGLRGEIKTLKSTIETKEDRLEELNSDIADSEEELAEQQSLFHDDQHFLKQLTSNCHEKAKMWDQRQEARVDELHALASAKAIIKQSVESEEGSTARGEEAPADFIQVAQRSFLKASTPTQKATALLEAKAKKLQSKALASVVAALKKDPFKKIKNLIQSLIDRLLQEAAAEAEQQGWCNTEMGKATHTRKSNHGKVRESGANIKENEAIEKQMEVLIGDLTDAISDLEDDLATAETNRDSEKTENEETIVSAKGAKKATKQAIEILKEHYRKAKAKATAADGKPVALIQADPATSESAGFKGAYGGKQGEGHGIIDMLEVIYSDFDRAISQTEQAEKDQEAQYQEFRKATTSSIAKKTTAKKNAQTDLKNARNEMNQNLDVLRESQEMIDTSMEIMQKLKAACVDTGMSFAQRKAKREEEIDALKDALDLLAPPS